MTVSATQANRSFSALLREVSRGKRVTVTSHGQAIAAIATADEDDAEGREKRAKAMKTLRERWAKREPIVVGPCTRDELYERD